MNHTRTSICRAAFARIGIGSLTAILLLPIANLFGAPPPPPPPAQGPAPLLYVRFVGQPAYKKMTCYPGGNQGRAFDAPVTLGLRPGYIYRFKIGDIADHPGVDLYPTLEVRGTLKLPPNVRAAEHPAPIVFSAEDINHVLHGAMVTKVVFLECPDLAIAEATKPNEPIVLETTPGGDPLTDARARGRPVMIIRLGERQYSDREMALQAIRGTILLPDERFLQPAAARPWIPFGCLPVVDPVLGPKPLEEECVKDGGDIGRPAGLDGDGKVIGIDPTDTVAAYSDKCGRHISISNRVCLCVPRFVVIRGETGLVHYDTVTGLIDTKTVQGQIQMKSELPSRESLQNAQIDAMHGRLKPSANIVNQVLDEVVKVQMLNAHEIEVGVAGALGTSRLDQLTTEQRVQLTKQIEFAQQFTTSAGLRGVENISGPSVVGKVQGLQVLATVQELREIMICCKDKPEAPCKPLHLYKWASATQAQIGDVVTYYLKYTNVGGQPITDVALSDSLSGRLEYVPGSAKSDRDAVFTMIPNQAGSLVLHWEFSGALPANQSGVVSFQAKIR